MNDEPVALVTGGSRGIGRAISLRLHDRGYRVAVAYHSDHEAAEELVASLEARRPASAMAVATDVGVESEVIQLFEAVDARLGRVSALVNNAAILKRQARVIDFDAARIEQVLRTNVVGTLLCCREAIRRMSTETGGQGGSIVNLSSVAARMGSPHEYIDYAASKGAVDTLTRGLAIELAADGIRVNAVRPGMIHTTIHASGGEADRVERLASSIPMGRGGTVDEVADAVVWLLGSEASYVNGAVLDVAGGL